MSGASRSIICILTIAMFSISTGLAGWSLASMSISSILLGALLAISGFGILSFMDDDIEDY